MERLNNESIKKINEIVEAHKDLRGPVMVMLHEVQDAFGYIPFEAIEKISEASGESVAEVFGVVNFYAQFTTEPKGKHIIKATRSARVGEPPTPERLSESWWRSWQ